MSGTASPGAPRRHTIYEVAEAAGVSIATVSRVLSSPHKVAHGTRERVLASIEELSYVPAGAARSLAARHNEAYGLVLPELRGPYYGELLSGFEAAAAERGASVVLLLTRGKSSVDLLVRRLAGKVDGLAVLGGVEVSQATLSAVRRKIPLVAVADTHHHDVETLSTENQGSARQLAGHLLDVHGRTSLVFVGDPDLAPDVHQRHLGFVEAHTDRGMTPAEPVRSELLEHDGEQVAAAVVRGDIRADGLVCANDELALSIQSRLLQHGVAVPDTVALTGWDDQMAARYVTPGLTTVRQPVRELGHLAVERIQHQLVEPGSRPPGHRLPTTVVIRQSCGCT